MQLGFVIRDDENSAQELREQLDLRTRMIVEYLKRSPSTAHAAQCVLERFVGKMNDDPDLMEDT